MKRLLLILVCLLVAVSTAWPSSWTLRDRHRPPTSKICQASRDVAVIVNRDNPLRKSTAQEIRALFDPSLGATPWQRNHVSTWADGRPIQFVASANSEACSSFFTMVRGGTCEAIVQRWKRANELDSVNAVRLMKEEHDVVQFVTINPGAIGLVSRKTLHVSTRRLRIYGFCKRGF